VHVVVTGASSGIGEALAREYLRRGAAVTVVARREQPLRELAAGFADRCHVVPADLSEPATSCDWVDGATRALGPVDVLVNNAGAQIVRRAVDTQWDEAERMIRLNTLMPWRLTLRVLPAMLARGSGAIVDVASIAAIAPTPGMSFYGASKAALAAASETLRGELSGTGVHVMTVYPGPVKTPLEEAGRAAYEPSALARLLTPAGDARVLARKIADGVEARRARIVYPAFFRVVHRFPNLARFVLARFTPPLRALPSAHDTAPS
jgi:short-subunit dehydrogenase